MRTHQAECLVDDLQFNPLTWKTINGFRENTAILKADQSRWMLREYRLAKQVHGDRIHHDFFRLFSPYHVRARRSVYEIKEGEKNFIGSAYSVVRAQGFSLLDSHDLHIALHQDIVNALAVLFFLNQPYSLLENVFVDLHDHYQVLQFDLSDQDAELTDAQYHDFLPTLHQQDASVSHFINKLIAADGAQKPEVRGAFLKKRELALLQIVIAPGFEVLFDFSLYPQMCHFLSFRQIRLREILLNADRFSDIIFQLSADDFCHYLNAYFRCLENYDPAKFAEYRDCVIQNYLSFFNEIVKNKLAWVITELQREMCSITYSARFKDTPRLFHTILLKAALNQFYGLLDLMHFFSHFTIGQFRLCRALLQVLRAIISYFEINDPHAKQLIALSNLIENVVNAHPSVRDVVQAVEKPCFEVVDLPDIMQIDELVQYCQCWISRTNLIGLDNVLVNKPMLLFFLDRALHLWQSNRKSPASGVADTGVVVQHLREQLCQANRAPAIEKILYQVIKSAEAAFLIEFFRQVILHVFLEPRLCVYIQKAMMQADFNEAELHGKIRGWLDQRVDESQVSHFCEKWLFHYDSIATDQGWCRVEIVSATPLASIAVSQPAFFSSNYIERVVVSSSERLLSAGKAIVSHESTQSMTDSLKSLAATTSYSASKAAASAASAVSSASEMLYQWWNRKT